MTGAHAQPQTPPKQPSLSEEAAPHLRPGERLTGTFLLQVDDLLPPRLPKKHRPGVRRGIDLRAPIRWAVGATPLPWLIPDSWKRLQWLVEGDDFSDHVERGWSRFYRSLRRPFHGRSWGGGYRSMAGSLLIAVRNAYDSDGENDDFLLVVTTERLLALSEPMTLSRHLPARLLAEFPREAFVQRQRPHPPRQEFRADVAFGDGSWIALKTSRIAQTKTLKKVL
ncbi:hypothetical protein ABR737_09010 [Streptomyces sp. Edi2]|uniref:hypothetical protein n=1 Tax=Streptomyces sp. Edi2 TaxID=3162528 RepID=UPI003305F548